MKLSVKMESIRQIIHDIASVLAILPLVTAGISQMAGVFVDEQPHIQKNSITATVKTQPVIPDMLDKQ